MSRPRPISLLLMMLTFTTGLVDAVSILGLGHVFTALMTGNVVFVGLAAAGAANMSAGNSLLALASFALGAFVGGRIAAARQSGSLRGWLLPVAIIEAALVVAAARAAELGGQNAPGSHAHGTTLYAIIALCAVAMGLRSATAVKIKDPDLKTTVLTLTLTGIAADAPMVGGDMQRWLRRVASVLSLGSGALLGGFLLLHYGLATPLLISAVLVLSATVAFAAHPRGRAPSGAER